MAYKVGDIVKPNKGPHKGHPHRVIAVKDGGYNIAPEFRLGLKARYIKYHLGAAHATEDDLKEDAPTPISPYTYSAALEKWFIAKNKKADVVDAKKEDSQTLASRKKAIETLQDAPLPESIEEAKKPYQITKKTSNKSLGRLSRRQDSLGTQARKELKSRKNAIASSKFPGKRHATKVLGHIIAGKKPLDSDTAEKLIKSLNIPSKSAVAQGIRKTAKRKASAYDRSQKAQSADEKQKQMQSQKKKERRSIEKEVTKKLAAKIQPVKTQEPPRVVKDPEDPFGSLSGRTVREKPFNKRPENLRPDVGQKPVQKKTGLIKRFVQKFLEEDMEEQVTGPKGRLETYLEKRATKKAKDKETKRSVMKKEEVEIDEVKKVQLVPGKKISKREFNKMKDKVRDAQVKRASANNQPKSISAVKKTTKKDQHDTGGLNDFFLRGPKAVVSALRTANLKPHAQLQVQKALLEPGNEAKFMKNPHEFAKSIVKEEIKDERIDATIALMKRLKL